MITRWRYCLSAGMITRWHYYIDAVLMITRWRYSPRVCSRDDASASGAIFRTIKYTLCKRNLDAIEVPVISISRIQCYLNAVMITRWQHSLSAAMIYRCHYCISVEMVSLYMVNVSNCKELWSARRKHQHIQPAGKYQ